MPILRSGIFVNRLCGRDFLILSYVRHPHRTGGVYPARCQRNCPVGPRLLGQTLLFQGRVKEKSCLKP